MVLLVSVLCHLRGGRAVLRGPPWKSQDGCRCSGHHRWSSSVQGSSALRIRTEYTFPRSVQLALPCLVGREAVRCPFGKENRGVLTSLDESGLDLIPGRGVHTQHGRGALPLGQQFQHISLPGEDSEIPDHLSVYFLILHPVQKYLCFSF